MNASFQSRIERTRALLDEAEHVVIGGGAGLSSAAGLTYSGARFDENFADFMHKYGMTDMYSAGFYPFASQEEKWAYWSRHILINRFEPPAAALYLRLYSLVKDRDYFVITTNVDHQFHKAGFAPERIFAVQGDYGKIQCAKGCHDRLYDDEAMVRQMAAEQRGCRVPACLVPKCPVCGGEMDVNIRKDAFFVQDKEWYAAADRYENFMERAQRGKAVLLELGVGFNTPAIIRFPFERFTYNFKNIHLVRMNRDYPAPIEENAAKTVSFSEDMSKMLSAL